MISSRPLGVNADLPRQSRLRRRHRDGAGADQIGAFTLPALLPGYIDRWALSKTDAGWLVGIFFAAYVPPCRCCWR